MLQRTAHKMDFVMKTTVVNVMNSIKAVIVMNVMQMVNNTMVNAMPRNAFQMIFYVDCKALVRIRNVPVIKVTLANFALIAIQDLLQLVIYAHYKHALTQITKYAQNKVSAI